MNKIQTAVKTTRHIQNTETGLDVVVPDFITTRASESKLDLLKPPKTAYHVVVTTVLKNATDGEKSSLKQPENQSTIHFAFDKDYHSFLKLREDLDKKYSGTYVPPVEATNKLTNKLAMNAKAFWKECRDNQIALDKFMKWCASTEKIAASPILTEFLGLNRLKTNLEDEKPDQVTENAQKKFFKKKYDADDLFDELDFTKGEKEHLFDGDNGEEVFKVSKTENNSSTSKRNAGLFETEDLTGVVSINDKELIFLEEEKSEKAIAIPNTENIAVEPDLSNFDEDLSSIASQLKDVPDIALSSFESTKKFTSKDEKLTPDQTTVAVDTMGGQDFLTYIQENTDKADDDLDLGF